MSWRRACRPRRVEKHCVMSLFGSLVTDEMQYNTLVHATILKPHVAVFILFLSDWTLQRKDRSPHSSCAVTTTVKWLPTKYLHVVWEGHKKCFVIPKVGLQSCVTFLLNKNIFRHNVYRQWTIFRLLSTAQTPSFWNASPGTRKLALISRLTK